MTRISSCGLGLTLGAAAALLLGASSVSNAQIPTPQSADREFSSSSPVSLGMGGGYLLNLTGAEAGEFNPAQVNNNGHMSFDVEAMAQSKNLNPTDVSNLVNDLKNINDNTNSGNIAQSDFNEAYKFALKAGATTGGAPGVITGQFSPLLAGSLGRNFAVVAYSSDDVLAKLNVGPSSAPGTRTLTAGADYLAISSVGIPIAIPFKGIRVGIDPKYIRADYQGFGFTANEATLTATGTQTSSLSKSAFDVDAGITTAVKNSQVQFALVGRHLASPSFNLAPGAKFKLSPEFDAGFGTTWNKVNYLFEAHNISNANNGGASLHLGAEKWLNKFIALRGGVNAGQFSFGVGLALGQLHLDVGAGSNPSKQAALGLSYHM